MSGRSLTTLLHMVAAGVGVTLIPEMSAEIEARTAPVVMSKLDELDASRDIGMVWRKSSPLQEQFREISGIVKSVASEIYERPRLLESA